MSGQVERMLAIQAEHDADRLADEAGIGWCSMGRDAGCWQCSDDCECDCHAPAPEVPADAALVGGEWCREETCRYRHWRSGSMPTHRRGADCPDPSPVGGDAEGLAALLNKHVEDYGSGCQAGCYPTTHRDIFRHRDEWRAHRDALVADWLAAHDAAVRAEALRDMADDLEDHLGAVATPYEVIDWLRDRAEMIAAELGGGS